MNNVNLCFFVTIMLSGASTQTLDSIMKLQCAMTDNSKQLPCNSNWEDILPALQMIKNNPNMKKERLYNVVKILKYLLADEMNNNECEVNEIISAFKDSGEVQTIPDIEKILEERFKTVDEATDPKACPVKDFEVQNDTAKNKTPDLSRILSKINTALANLKSQNDATESQNPSQMMPIFRSRNGCKTDFTSPSFEYQPRFENFNSNPAGKGLMSSKSTFNIPCQRASDILEETANFAIPRDAFCDISPINLDSLGLNPKLNLENLGINPNQIVPNSISCVDSDDTIGVVFKPKLISMMQVYGNLLKKITITVLVPYYAAKIVS